MSALTLNEQERRAYADGDVAKAALLRLLIDANELFSDVAYPEYHLRPADDAH